MKFDVAIALVNYYTQMSQTDMMYQLHCRSVSADSKLTTQLACLRCAKMECRGFDAAASDSFEDLFATAMHHADEQVSRQCTSFL